MIIEYHGGDIPTYGGLLPVRKNPLESSTAPQVPTQLPTSFHLASPNATSTAFGTTVGGASRAGEAPNT